ncbi:hypothetical protein GOBAR_AA26606 [Gossypium barbadense]|uniref:Uncharacterized protein n=1 Tax=Gossypium barbadense TaxID=3634 RepID=A0A2P5WSJ5_GOSBA|nr:hypothetical protein GOBAR_AA26606 [Gossypium barbadense]
MYVEAIRKAMVVNSRRAQTMNKELFTRDLETFRVQEYIGRRSACARANLNVEQFIDEIYTLQHTLRIWGNKFPVIPDVSNWEVSPPAFEMGLGHNLRRHHTG